MTKCSEKICKFEIGKALGFVEYQDNGDIWRSFELSITSGNKIGTIDPKYMFYSVMTDNRGSVIGKFLNYGSLEYPIHDINYLSAKLSKDGQFVISGSRHNDSALSAIERGNITLTEYGEEVLSECFTNTREYYAPTDHSQDSFSDYSNGDTDQSTNLDLL